MFRLEILKFSSKDLHRFSRNCIFPVGHFVLSHLYSLYAGGLIVTGAHHGLSLTINLEQYEDLAGRDDEAGLMVCIIVPSFLTSAAIFSIHIVITTRLILTESLFTYVHCAVLLH